jgi:hypothetical protein
VDREDTEGNVIDRSDLMNNRGQKSDYARHLGTDGRRMAVSSGWKLGPLTWLRIDVIIGCNVLVELITSDDVERGVLEADGGRR